MIWREQRALSLIDTFAARKYSGSLTEIHNVSYSVTRPVLHLEALPV